MLRGDMSRTGRFRGVLMISFVSLKHMRSHSLGQVSLEHSHFFWPPAERKQRAHPFKMCGLFFFLNYQIQMYIRYLSGSLSLQRRWI